MITQTSFSYNDQLIHVYTLLNNDNTSVEISSLGARIISIFTKDRNNNLDDILVGRATPKDYIGEHGYYGATIGRYGNRIGNAQFRIGGTTYHLSGGKHTLHGGVQGFDQKLFSALVDGNVLRLSYTSPDGEEGFPGTLDVQVSFELTEDNELKITYDAQSDKDTVCNLTNHAYFNLGNEDTVLNQVLFIDSDKITLCDDELIPHNEYLDIENTPFSFKTPKTIGKDIHSKEHLIDLCNGFDFNYVLNRKTPHELEYLMWAYDPTSGRKLECATTLPGVQLYTSNHLNLKGKKEYGDYAGFCLETQQYPNSPNCPNYPSPFLKEGENYHEETIYKFSVVSE